MNLKRFLLITLIIVSYIIVSIFLPRVINLHNSYFETDIILKKDLFYQEYFKYSFTMITILIGYLFADNLISKRAKKDFQKNKKCFASRVKRIHVTIIKYEKADERNMKMDFLSKLIDELEAIQNIMRNHIWIYNAYSFELTTDLNTLLSISRRNLLKPNSQVLLRKIKKATINILNEV